MSTFDRNKFRATKVSDLKKQDEEAKEVMPQSSVKQGIEILKLESGKNKLRFFPPHPDHDHWCVLKCVTFLPQEVYQDDKKQKWNNPTPEQIKEKNLKLVVTKSPIFNARVHSPHKKDVVEEYIAFYEKMIKDQFLDNKKAADDKIAFIKHFKTGLASSYSWVAYALKIGADKSRKFGRVDLKTSIKNALFDMCIDEDEDEPISVDPFTDPDDGRAVIVTVDTSEGTKAQDMYKTAIDLKGPTPLTDEELEKFNAEKPLSEILGNNCYKRSDFEKAVRGLQLYDEQNDLGVFAEEEWLDILEKLDSVFVETEAEKEAKKERENKKAESAKETKASSTKTTPPATKNEKVVEKEEPSIDPIESELDWDTLEEMDRVEMKAFIKSESLDISFTSKTSDEDLRQLIADELGIEVPGDSKEVDEDDEEEEVEEETDEEEAPSVTSKFARFKAGKK